MATDLYAVLGLTPHATQAEITHAYRVLLRRHHPDTRARDDQSKGGVADATLQQVLAAYQVLGDPARRVEHDRERGRTAQAPARVKVRVHRLPEDPMRSPPIQAGPVRWHHPGSQRNAPCDDASTASLLPEL